MQWASDTDCLVPGYMGTPPPPEEESSACCLVLEFGGYDYYSNTNNVEIY